MLIAMREYGVEVLCEKRFELGLEIETLLQTKQ